MPGFELIERLRSEKAEQENAKNIVQGRLNRAILERNEQENAKNLVQGRFNKAISDIKALEAKKTELEGVNRLLQIQITDFKTENITLRDQNLILQDQLYVMQSKERRLTQNRVGISAALIATGIITFGYSVALLWSDKELAAKLILAAVFLIVIGAFIGGKVVTNGIQSTIDSISPFFSRGAKRVSHLVDGAQEVVNETKDCLREIKGTARVANDELRHNSIHWRGMIKNIGTFFNNVATSISNGIRDEKLKPTANVVVRDNPIHNDISCRVS